MAATAKLTRMRIRGGIPHQEVLCGGYVTYKSRNEIKSIEVRVWMPAGVDYADCGTGTRSLTRALTAKCRKEGRCGPIVSECWQY